MSYDVTADYDYLIYKSGTSVMVKNGATGLTEDSMTSTNASVPFAAVRDAMGNTGKVCKVKSGQQYVFSSTVVFDVAAGHQYQSWLGSGGKWSLAQLKANGNYPVFEITGGQSPIVALENLYFTHNTNGYNTGLIRFKDIVTEVNVDGCRFYDFGQKQGDAMLFDLTTDLKQQYRIRVGTSQCYGLDNFLHWKANYAGTPSNNFMNGMHFSDCFVTNCKRIAKVDGVSGGAVSGHVFDMLEYQWISGNDGGANSAIFDMNGDAGLISGQLRFNNCLVWDIPATINMLNTNTHTNWASTNCNFGRVGGSGFIEGQAMRYDEYSIKEGTNLFSGTGLLKQFSITHGLGYIPRKIYLEATVDIHSIYPCFAIRDSTLTTTSMTVWFARPPPIGTNNVSIKWRVDQ